MKKIIKLLKSFGGVQKLSMPAISYVLFSVAFPQFIYGTDNHLANRKEKTYYNITQISMLSSNKPYLANKNIDSRGEFIFFPSVIMSHGLMFNHRWAAGVGAGFEIWDRNLFPLFVDIRYSVKDYCVSPVFALKMGYAFSNYKKIHYDPMAGLAPFSETFIKRNGGFLLNPEIGVKFPFTEKADLLVTVAYRHQRLKSTSARLNFSNQTYDELDYEHSLHHLSFGIAVMFRNVSVRFPQLPDKADNRLANRKEKRYYNITQIGMLTGKKPPAQTIHGDLVLNDVYQFFPSVTMQHGYMFNNRWAAGIGAGFEMFAINLFPVFSDIRFTLWDNKVSPFFSSKMGYAFGEFKKNYTSNYSYVKRNGGLMLSLETGLKFPLTEKADLLVTIAYRQQRFKTSEALEYMNKVTDYRFNMHRVLSGVAIMFR